MDFVVPVPAPDDAFETFRGTLRILTHLLLVVVGTEPVLAPFFDVAMHVEQSERVGLFRSDRFGMKTVALTVPSELVDVLAMVSRVIVGLRSGAAGEFQFGFGRQPVSVARHDGNAFLLNHVAGLEILQLTEPVAEADCVKPRRAFDGELPRVFSHDVLAVLMCIAGSKAARVLRPNSAFSNRAWPLTRHSECGDASSPTRAR